MTRYFQNNNGTVFRAGHVRSTVPDARFEARPDEYIEVQVVPLDAIVIRREEFAARPVLHHEGQIKSGGAVIPSHSLPEYAEDTSRHYLALAQWLRENPPVAVDEAQVKALTRALSETHVEVEGGISHFFATTARRLVERGVRVDVPAKQPQPEKSEDIKAWLKDRGVAS